MNEDDSTAIINPGKIRPETVEIIGRDESAQTNPLIAELKKIMHAKEAELAHITAIGTSTDSEQTLVYLASMPVNPQGQLAQLLDKSGDEIAALLTQIGGVQGVHFEYRSHEMLRSRYGEQKTMCMICPDYNTASHVLVNLQQAELEVHAAILNLLIYRRDEQVRAAAIRAEQESPAAIAALPSTDYFKPGLLQRRQENSSNPAPER